MVLSPTHITQFINQGFIKIENAFPAEIAVDCLDLLWEAIPCDPKDPSTWTQPVIWISEMTAEPFVKAANTPILHNAFDALVGKGNWMPRQSIGSFPIRFPSNHASNDTGWHVDASFPGEDPSNYFEWRINVHSKARGLLMLFLFSDVGDLDAPTRIKASSHMDVARILEPEGDPGLSFMELASRLDTLPEREEVLATGTAGTVYLCHPFIVHAAQEHRGARPKFMAQPPLMTIEDFNIHKPGSLLSPVEMGIVKGLK